jgi:redox-sensitive bicupin YhaK (pirin superfamily)
MGSDQPIRPGAVNWMTAGRGIAHSERSSAQARREGARVHGIQSWVALPRADEEAEPSFHHHPADRLPEVSLQGARARVLVGSAYGASSPVHVFSPMFYVEVWLEAGAEIAMPDAFEERAVYVVEGAVGCGRASAESGGMLVVRPSVPAVVCATGPAHVMLLGGAPLDGDRHIWWNFVSSSPERIERAKRDWKEGRFPKIPGDDVEFIPLPE